MPAAVHKYLDRRAVRGPWRLAGVERRNFGGAVVIPALAEEQNLPETLTALAAGSEASRKRFLVVVVVNNRKDAPAEWRRQNQGMLAFLQQGAGLQGGLSLSWVDAASPGLELPDREGVGLARRIGFDLVLEYLDWHDNPLLVSLDADTLTDPDYLSALVSHFECSPLGAAVLPFQHRPAATPQLQEAINRYELYLHHYVAGLALAGSPYAYHTIGSALACRARTYVAAGGMNRRRAGEDFYFLQQLAKTEGVGQVGGTVVRPSARISARTPFGTGPALARMQAGGDDAVRFSSMKAFQILGDFLLLANEEAGGKEPGQLPRRAEALSPTVGSFLEQCSFQKVWDKLCRQHRQPQARRRAFHQWFDALRTRQLISHICEQDSLWGSDEAVLPPFLAHLGLPSSGNPVSYLDELREYQKKKTGVRHRVDPRFVPAS